MFIDVGAGSSLNFEKSGAKFEDLEAILFTHLHGDHNAIPESASGAASWLHMKPSEIGEIAKQAKVKQVVLSHRVQRTLGKKRETKQHIEQSL